MLPGPVGPCLRVVEAGVVSQTAGKQSAAERVVREGAAAQRLRLITR
jgi:hypothetical protein